MKKRIVSLFLVLISVLSVLILPLSAAGSATTELRDFATSDVDTDLIGSTYVNSAGLRKKIESASDIVSEFPKKDGGEPSIIELMEVGYDPAKGSSSNVVLYLWVYIPDFDFQPSSAQNKVTLATAFDTNPLGKGVVKAEQWVAESYEQHGLRHIGTSTSGTVYKFAVDGFDARGCISAGERRYNISRFDLHYKGSSVAQNYTAGRTYICTGEHADRSYSAGANGLDVLEIDDLYQTVFRYNNIGDAFVERATQINSVYFSIPSEHELVYGDLSSIKTDWRRYRSTPMVVMATDEGYNKFLPWQGKIYGTSSMLEPWFALYSYEDSIAGGELMLYYYDYYFGSVPSSSSMGYNNYIANEDAKEINPLFWLFKSEGGGSVSLQETLTFYEEYASKQPDLSFQKLYVNGVVQYCNPLTDETYGKKSITILASDKMDEHLQGYEYCDLFDVFAHFLSGERIDTDDLTGVDAIQTISNTDVLPSSNASEQVIYDFCNSYLIDRDDYDDFRSFCKKEITSGNTVVVLHYANSEYEVYPMQGAVGYAAIQDIFLDFTLIQMEFGDEYSRTIIPVSVENINDIPGIDRPGDIGDNPPTYGDKWAGFLADLKGLVDQIKQIVWWVIGVVAVALLIWGGSFLLKSVNAVGGYISDKADDARRRREEKREREERNKRWRK